MITQAVLTLCRNDGDSVLPFIVYTLDNVLISHISVSGGSGGKPVETLSLNFSKIKWELKAQKLEGAEKGAAASTWDMAMNKNGG